MNTYFVRSSLHRALLAGFFLALFVQSASAATLSFSPQSQTLNVGDTFTVQLLLDTQGVPVDGVDINALHYNPALLKLNGGQLAPGTLFPTTVTNAADASGAIRFSQVTFGGTSYNGSDTLGTLSFTALAAGTASLTFDFTPGNTTQTLVASKGANVLTSVGSGTYSITTASAPTSVSSTTASAPTPTPVPSSGSGGGSGSPAPAPSSGGGGGGGPLIESYGSGSVTAPVLTTTNTTQNVPSSIPELQQLIQTLVEELKQIVVQRQAAGLSVPAALITLLQSYGATTVAPVSSSASCTITTTITLGSRGPDVTCLQKFLNTAYENFTPDDITGYFGPTTDAALKQWQREHGIVSSGTPATTGYGAAGPRTRALIATLMAGS